MNNINKPSALKDEVSESLTNAIIQRQLDLRNTLSELLYAYGNLQMKLKGDVSFDKMEVAGPSPDKENSLSERAALINIHTLTLNQLSHANILLNAISEDIRTL